MVWQQPVTLGEHVDIKDSTQFLTSRAKRRINSFMWSPFKQESTLCSLVIRGSDYRIPFPQIFG